MDHLISARRPDLKIITKKKKNFKIVDFIVPDIGIMVRVFDNGPRDLGSIPGRVIPDFKTATSCLLA